MTSNQDFKIIKNLSSSSVSSSHNLFGQEKKREREANLVALKQATCDLFESFKLSQIRNGRECRQMYS